MVLWFTDRLRRMAQIIPKVVFVLGAPGAGKGTQCQNIVKEFGFVHLSAGDLLREERCRPNSQYGELIESYIRDGKIVPVDITCSLLERAMKESGKRHFLIDGFPRNQDNLDGWNRRVADKIQFLFVLFFDCSQDICIQRCLNRGAAGSGRSDDNMDSLKKRFNTYVSETQPIIDYYDKQNLVRRIDASHPPELVFNNVKAIFEELPSKDESD